MRQQYRRARLVVATCLTLLLAGSLLAERATSLEQQRPEFGATISRVRVDVIVTDDEGDFVDDLTLADFRVFEDDVEQEVLDAQLVDLASGTVSEIFAAPPGDDLAGAPGGAAAPTGAVAAGSSGSRASELGAIIYLLDYPGLDFKVKKRFTEVLAASLQEAELLAVPRAIYVIDQVGRLREVVPLTGDREAFQGGVRRLAEDPLALDEWTAGMPGDLAELPNGIGVERELVRSRFTMRQLSQFGDGLAARGGRTALVWVSKGVLLGRYGSPGRGGSHARPDWRYFSPDPRTLDRQRAFHEALNSANVSVYAVDPTPLAQLLRESGGTAITDQMLGGDPGPAADPAAEPPQPDLSANPGRVDSTRDDLGDALRHAAAATGGDVMIGYTDLGLAIDRVERDTGRFYLLTYAAPPPEGDGEYHEIEVRVDRPGVELRARRGYRDHAPDERRNRAVSAALSLPGTVTGFEVEAEVSRTLAREEGEDRQNVMLAAGIPTGELGVRLDAEGRAHHSLVVHAAVLDGGGELLEELHESFEVPLADATRTRTGRRLVFRHEWTLDRDERDLRLLVVDDATGRMAATALEVEPLPSPDEGWSTGDLVLVQRHGETPTPVVGGRIHEGTEAFAWLEIYGGSWPVLEGRVRRLADDATAGALSIFPLPAAPVGPGLHRGSVPLPTLSPGDYELALEVRDPDAGAERTLTRRLRILPAPGREP